MVSKNVSPRQGGVSSVKSASGNVFHALLSILLTGLLLGNFLALAPGNAFAQIGYGKRWYPENIYLEGEAVTTTQIRLSWQLTNQNRDYTDVRIYRANPLTPDYFEFLTCFKATTVSFTDSNLKPNTTYRYQIQFQYKRPTMLSGTSNKVTVTTMDPNNENSVPTNPNLPRYTSQDPNVRSAIKTLTAKALASNKIELRWGAPRMTKVASLRVFRADPENPTEFILLEAVAANKTSWIDATVYPKKTYSYMLRYNIGHGTVLSPPSNIATATTPDGDLPTEKPRFSRTNVIANSDRIPENTIQGQPVVLQPAYFTQGNNGTAVPLDSREEELLALLNAYRAEKGAGPVRPSITITRASDEFAKELASTGKLGKTDAAGRNTRTRVRAWGYDVPTVYDTVTLAARMSPAEIIEQVKTFERDNEVLINPIWKTIGLARAYDDAGTWYWVFDFSAFWDYTIPLPGEDEDGRIDGNELIRTRPPKDALAKGHFFSGYGDDGKPYSSLHCDLETKACWKDPAPPGNPALDELSDPDNLIGVWHVQYQISPSGITHFNDFNGYDLTEFTMNLQINKDGTWVSQGYKAYQRPTPVEAGTWKSVHDISRNEELVTFYRDEGRPTVQLRVHATKGRLTFLVRDGGAETKDFFKSVPADYNKKDDEQVIFTPGLGFLLGPADPFPANKRCATCPR